MRRWGVIPDQPCSVGDFHCNPLDQWTSRNPSTVFAGGHQRWINNRNGCDNDGRDAIPDPGLEGLTTAGAPELSGGRARYTMSKANADNMLTTGGPVDRQQQPVGLGLMRAGCRSFRHLPAARAGLSGSVSADGPEVQNTGRLACRLSAPLPGVPCTA